MALRIPGSLSSGGGPAWLTPRRAAAALVDSTFTGEWWSDFDETARIGTLLAVSGVVTASQTDKGGVLLAATAATGGSRAVWFPAGQPSVIATADTETFYAYFRARFQGPGGAGAQIFCSVGLARDFSVGIDGSFQTGGSDTNWVVSVYNGTTRTNTASAIPFDTASYHDVELTSNGIIVAAKIDGVSVGTMTATGIGATTPANIFGQIFTNDATVRTLRVDKAYIAYHGN